ncbi:MAG: Gfo/Idh/MocA family oxidoreductase [Planctomycetaceae bacterium]|nr:Gfo/Idh/MocA family oxidoreductase [Planctomycetaceae bacterium]
MPTGQGQSPSRRSFLKTSSVAFAGAAAVSQLSAVSAAHVSFDETIKIGLIGCGGRGRGAADQAMNTEGPTRLVAVADAFGDNLESALTTLKRQHPDQVDVPKERQFTGFDAYQRVLEQDVDLVILATPPGFRPLHFEAAVNAGKHVFMEKPVAVDAHGVRQVIEANKIAKAKNLAVQVGLQRHHEPIYIETINRLKDGAIGRIVATRAYWNGGGVWVRPRKEEQTEMEYQMRNWYYFNWLCGDHITEQHIHNLDVINWLMGDYPVEAQGQGGRQVRTGKEYGEIFDHHFVEYTYEAGGEQTFMLSQCRHIQNCMNSVTEFAHGSNGWCELSEGRIFDAKGNLTWEYPRKDGEKRRNLHDGWQQEHHDLFAALRKGERPNEAEYGAYSSMTSVLGRMATYSGKAIKWADALASDIRISPVEQFHAFTDTPPVLPNDDMTYAIPTPGVTKVL